MRNRRALSALVAGAGALLFAGCADQASDPAADYVLLLDDDSDPDQVLGRAGAYALTARGSGEPPLAVLETPAGYSNFGFFALVPEGFAESDDPLRSVQYWTVDGVFVDPCAMDRGAPSAGSSVDDLVDALAAQHRTSVSPGVPVSLDGHQGTYLELTAPTDISFTDCDAGYYGLWEGRPDDAQHTVDSPGTTDHVWILDLDGERVVLLAATPPGVTDEQAEELTEIVESVRFVPAESQVPDDS